MKIREGAPQEIDQIASLEMTSEIIHRFGHEIGNPLTSIISFATIIERLCAETQQGSVLGDKVLSKISTYSKLIAEEAWRTNSLNERLVSLFSKRNSGNSLTDVAAALRETLEKLNIKGAIDSDLFRVSLPDSEVYVKAEWSRLIFLFTEILVNAYQAMSAFGVAALDGTSSNFSARIALTVEGDKIKLSIRNPSPEKSLIPLEKLFEPFVCGRKVQSRSGLGLTVCAVIVSGLKGTISISEIEEEGRIFFQTTVFFPAESAPKQVSAITGEQNQLLPQELHFLIIEDESSVSSAIEKLLTLSFKPHTKINTRIVAGLEAMFLLENDPRIHVVICDLNLDGISGIEIYKRILESHPMQALKFAFLTGDRNSKEAQAFFAANKLPFLYKPFEVQELVQLVFQVLENVKA